MCTLSWISDKNTLSIMFNRDEADSRPTAIPPALFEEGQIKVIRPTDTLGGGSWISVNDRGLVLCLMNFYDVQRRETPPANSVSRGQLVTRLAACSDFTSLEEALREFDLECFAPFILVVFEGFKGPVTWRWDGVSMQQNQGERSPLTTSSTLSKLTSRFRRLLFRRHRVKGIDNQRLLHQWSHPLLQSISPAMRRRGRGTVSTTQVMITNDHVQMEYWDGHPDHQSDVPDMSQSLIMRSPQSGALHSMTVTDLELGRILHQKNPTLARKLSPLQLRLMNGVIGLPKLQRKLEAFSHLSVDRFFDEAMAEIGTNVHVEAFSWPQRDSRPVFVCNHPTGGLDGIVLLAVLRLRYPDIRVVANDLLGLIPQLQPLQIPVDVFGNRAASGRTLHQAFAGEHPLLVFPAGKTARIEQGQLDDGPWSRMPAALASRYGRAITPLHLLAQNSRKFYALAWLRKRLGIKTNLEMLLLIRELLNPANSVVSLRVSESITPPEFPCNSSQLRQLTEQVKQVSYGLFKVTGEYS